VADKNKMEESSKLVENSMLARMMGSLVADSCMMVVDKSMMVAGRPVVSNTLVVNSKLVGYSTLAHKQAVNNKLEENSLDNMKEPSIVVDSHKMVVGTRSLEAGSKLVHKLVENSTPVVNNKLVVDSCTTEAGNRNSEAGNKLVGCSKPVGYSTQVDCSKLARTMVVNNT